MKIRELDFVRLKDGRKGTVVDSHDSRLFLVETEDDMSQWPTVEEKDIEEVLQRLE
ncbi:hypothetical protein [Pyramidobacter piscolens]|uniref:hypothetical protein n=1 Tax=Pyramidobacter piscolens TaxID=638849 RepID=UPI001FCBECA0|nr:hypothetical protein [Pyramidobacter piscolens]BDF77870.1 hypothetical protein CE91St28_06640 [Pyramidobacter piscolens]